jgi:hypothetical protein
MSDEALPGPARRRAAAGRLDLEIWLEGGCLRFYVRGSYDPVSAQALLALIPVEARRENCQYVLVDIREVSGEGSTLNRFEMGAAAAAYLVSLRVAIIWRPEETDRFAETVAVNRGASLLVFTNEPDALAWLLGKPK